MLGSLASLLPAGPASVLIDGAEEYQALLATRIATVLNASGRACVRLPAAEGSQNAEAPCIPADAIRLADGPRWRSARSWDVVIWLRTAPSGHDGGRDGRDGRDGEDGADIVIDMHDPGWPVIRCVAAPLAGHSQWYLTETRAFFACRAATWDTKFGDDLPGYAAAIARAGIPDGGVVIDVGCGTGRALPPLRRAAGPAGAVIAVDMTPEMLSQARQASLEASAALVLADARHLPLADASADAIFAAGLINHLPDTQAGLRELARVTRPEGLLILFHPSGRAALAARHGRTLSPEEPLAPDPLRQATQATGWRLTDYDDAADHFFAIAVRARGLPASRTSSR
jgi:SAM-dependent methyltransferase